VENIHHINVGVLEPLRFWPSFLKQLHFWKTTQTHFYYLFAISSLIFKCLRCFGKNWAKWSDKNIFSELILKNLIFIYLSELIFENLIQIFFSGWQCYENTTSSMLRITRTMSRKCYENTTIDSESQCYENATMKTIPLFKNNPNSLLLSICHK